MPEMTDKERLEKDIQQANQEIIQLDTRIKNLQGVVGYANLLLQRFAKEETNESKKSQENTPAAE